MPDHLSGTAVLFDGDNAVLLGGHVALISDGTSRSEIILTGLDGEREERFVFASDGNWIPVYQVIQGVRELYDASPTPHDLPTPVPCPACGGTGMVEDAEGNWRDCPDCAP